MKAGISYIQITHSTYYVLICMRSQLHNNKCASKMHIRQMGEGAVTTMCYTPPPFQRQHFRCSLHASYLHHSRDQE